MQGVVVAPRGTAVHGQLVSAQSAGRMSGGSELALESTNIVINNTAHPIMTNTYKGKDKADKPRVAWPPGAGLGSVIGAVVGGRGAAGGNR